MRCEKVDERETDSAVKGDGLRRWKHAMERKSALEWMSEKEAPRELVGVMEAWVVICSSRLERSA